MRPAGIEPAAFRSGGTRESRRLSPSLDKTAFRRFSPCVSTPQATPGDRWLSRTGSRTDLRWESLVDSLDELLEVVDGARREHRQDRVSVAEEVVGGLAVFEVGADLLG